MNSDYRHALSATTESECTLTSFDQGEQCLRLAFSGATAPIDAFALNNVAPVITAAPPTGAHRLTSSVTSSVSGLENTVQVQLSSWHERLDHEYSIVLYFSDTEQGNYIELVRQNEQWLKHTFNFSRSGGYTILGRRSGVQIRRNGSQTHDLGPVFTVVPMSSRQQALPPGYSELDEAREVTVEMHRCRIGAGPSNGRHLCYSLLPPERQLERIWKGKPPVQCSGFRDVWLALMAQRGIRVRAIEARDEVQLWPDLVTYGHSCAEIWGSETQSWVLYDPWFGGITCSLEGEYLDAESLCDLVASESQDLKRITLACDVKSVERFFVQADGTRRAFTVKPESLHVLEPTIGSLGMQPPYSTYFRNVEIRNVQMISTVKRLLNIARRAFGKLLVKRPT